MENLELDISDQRQELGWQRTAISDIIEREECIETITIEEALSECFISPTPESAFGRTDIHPSTVRSLRKSGILPLSRDLHKDWEAHKKKSGLLLKRLKLPNMSLKETKGFRVRVAYRLIRYMSRIRGDQPAFSPLSVCLNGLWKMPQPFRPDQGYIDGTKGIRALLHAWSNSNNTFTYNDRGSLMTVKGVTYLPPAISDQAYIIDGANSYEDIWKDRVSRKVPKNYDPDEDESLIYFCETMEMLADKLQAHEGSYVEPDAGILGIVGLLSPRTARIAWPTIDELIMYEDDLVMHIYDDILTRSSSNNSEKEIMRLFGVERFEAMDLLRMAREVGTSSYREDMEQARIMAIGRMDRVADHAESFDIRTSLAAMKEGNKLKGLTRIEETSEQEEFRNYATRAVEFKEDN